jgi:predicted dehydrogenase
MGDLVRWGVAGPGSIAAQFAEGMRQVDGGTVVAVASRSSERAKAFAERFDIERPYGSYEDLAADDGVDVVYIGTPHSRHAADSLLYIGAGKHVLCEKPFTLNAAQAREVVAAARERARFVMEAMWTRFLPSYRVLSDVLAEGRIGEPLLVEADFGFRSPVDPTNRHFDLEQGGGALLDLGIYPVQLCHLVLRPPDAVVAQGHVGETGVDEQVAAVLHHAGGKLGVVKTAIRTPMACTGRIAGTDGTIDLPAFMHCPDHITVRGAGGEERIDAPWKGEGLRFQVEEVHRCLDAGLLESERMRLDESVAIAETLDAIRAQIGVRYPGEEMQRRRGRVAETPERNRPGEEA